MKKIRSLGLTLFTLGLFVIGAYLRWANIGAIEPHVDESGNLLTSIDAEFRAIVEPGEFGRPLLGVIFRLVPFIANVLNIDLLSAARLQSGLVGLLTAAMLGILVRREAGAIAGFFAAGLWLLMPFTILHERLVLQDPFNAFFLVGACLVLSFAGDVTDRKRLSLLLMLTGGLLALATGNKIYALLDIPWIIGFGLLVWRRQRRPLEPVIVFCSTILGFLIATGFIPWSDFEKMSVRAAGFSYHLPSFTLGEGLALGATLLPRSIGLYSGLVGLALFGVGLVWAWQCLVDRRHLFVGAMVSVMLYGVAFSSTSYARYALPLAVPFIILVSFGYGDFVGRWYQKSARLALTISLGCVISFWIQGVRGAIVSPMDNRWSHLGGARLAAEQFTDYEMYTLSFFGGSGLKELFHLVKDGGKPPLLVVGAPWLAAANGLRLACLERKACEVRRLGERQADGAFVLAEWFRLNSGERRIFLVGEDRCRDYGEEARCRGSVITAWPGIELGPTVDLTRKDGASIFRVAEVRGVSRGDVVMLGGERRLPFSDGFLSPATRIDLDHSFHGARAIRIEGEAIEGLSNMRVKVTTPGGGEQVVTIPSGSTSFEVALETQYPGKFPELHLDFSDWVVSGDETEMYGGYWGGSRAVSFKFTRIEAVASPNR